MLLLSFQCTVALTLFYPGKVSDDEVNVLQLEVDVRDTPSLSKLHLVRLGADY